MAIIHVLIGISGLLLLRLSRLLARKVKQSNLSALSVLGDWLCSLLEQVYSFALALYTCMVMLTYLHEMCGSAFSFSHISLEQTIDFASMSNALAECLYSIACLIKPCK